MMQSIRAATTGAANFYGPFLDLRWVAVIALVMEAIGLLMFFYCDKFVAPVEEKTEKQIQQGENN
jgi:hypothetical protein